MCMYSSVHPHNVMKRGSMTVLGNTIQKHLTGTAFRSYNLLKQEREIQVHKTELLTMEFRHLHLTFCKIEFILTTEGQISQCLQTFIISVETFQFLQISALSRLSVRKPGLFQNSAYPWLQHVVTISGRAA